MKTVYILTAWGGHYEDRWENIEGVFFSREGADRMQRQLIAAHGLDPCETPGNGRCNRRLPCGFSVEEFGVQP